MMKNKFKLTILLALLVGCSSNNNSTSKHSDSSQTVSSTPISSSVVSSSNSTNIVSSTSSKIDITPSNPTLNVMDDIRININEKVNYLNLVNAYDTIDGNISHLISVNLPNDVTMENGYLSFAKVGLYTIEFNVTNSSNLSASKTISIEVYEISDKDVTAPNILGHKNIRVKPEVMAYPLEGVTASDDMDGDISSSLIATYQNKGDATDGISFAEEGFYEITISVEDSAGNHTEEIIEIEVNSEDIPTYVNMTENVLIEYNCTIAASNVVPYEGAQSKEVTLKVKTSQVYANFRLSFDEPMNLANKQMSMYVKLGDNVKADRLSIDLRQGTEGAGQMQYILTQSSGTGYKIEDKGDGWFLLTIVFDKVWNISTYVTDYIRLVFANDDITKAANIYVADVLMDDYKGEIDEGGNEDTPTLAQDLTDTMEVNYNCVHELDNEVSHDGEQSLKIKAFDEWTSSKSYVNQDLDGYIITFYVKFSGTSIYKNRVYAQFKDPSDANIIGDILISAEDTLPEGVTIGEADANGWAKVTIDCSAVGVGGTETRKFILKFRCSDATAKDGVAWVDELYIVKKEAE